MKPLISIGCPVKNGFKNKNKFNLKDALDSILNQTYKNLEIIISDDLSDDETKDFLEQISKKDKRIKLFFQKENLGWEKNFKFVLDKSSGKYFKFSCQDDIISKDYIESNFNFLEKNLDFVCSSSKFSYEDKPDEIKSFNLDQNLFERIKNFFKIRHISHNILYSLIRKERMNKTIDFAKKYWAIDWIFDLDLIIEGKFKTIQDGFIKFGVHGSSKEKNFLNRENLKNKKIYKILPFYELMKYLFNKTIRLNKLSFFQKLSIYFSSLKINFYFLKKLITK